MPMFIRPLAGMLLVGGALLFPPRARQAEAFPFCRVWLNGPCTDWDDEELGIACTGLCPTWYMAFCDKETGRFYCIDEPS